METATKSCPRCREPMTRFHVFGLDLDECVRCRGLWFDAQELDAVKDQLDQDVRWKDVDLRGHAARTGFQPAELPCAECGAALCHVLFDDTQVDLLFCAACGGVWVDKGKLGPVLDHFRERVEEEPTRQVAVEAWRQFLEIFHGGRKGAWGEIKDFAAAWRLLTLKFMVDHPALQARLEVARRSLPF